jgi:uncharacterized protein (TIGR02246 family)
MESIAIVPKHVAPDRNCISTLRVLSLACCARQVIARCIRPIAVAVIVMVWMTSLSAAQPPAGAGALVDAFARAWNTHDGSAFGLLYADDADWVMVSGERLKGRTAIEQALAKEHGSWARTTTLRAAGVRVRELDPRRAIVMFRWEIVSDAQPEGRPYRGNTVLIAEKTRKGWVIVAGQASAMPSPK